MFAVPCVRNRLALYNQSFCLIWSHPRMVQVTAWEVRFGTGGARDRFRNSLTRTPDGRLVYGNPRGPLQLITQEHVRRQPKEELGWRLPENTSWEVRAGPTHLPGPPDQP